MSVRDFVVYYVYNARIIEKCFAKTLSVINNHVARYKMWGKWLQN